MSTVSTERPIIFSADMVRAILAGRKTQTRRVIKPQPPIGTDAMRDVPGTNRWWAAYATTNDAGVTYRPLGSDQQHEWRCPYFPGQRLWVREAWCHKKTDAGYFVYTDGDLDPSCVWYAATDHDIVHMDDDGAITSRSPWSSPIHMPRWASRITLEVVRVWVERVQDITFADVLAEGIPQASAVQYGQYQVDTIESYVEAWDRLNAKRGYPWSANPWVFAIEFKNADAVMAAEKGGA